MKSGEDFTQGNHGLCFSGGMDVMFSMFQSFLDASAYGWCFFTLEDSVHGLMLRKLSSTLYRWQGIFVPFKVSITYVMVHRLKCTCRFWMLPEFLLFLVSQDLSVENPKTCEAFNIGLPPYFVITHEERNEEKSSVTSVYTFTSGFELFLVKKLHFIFRLLYLKEKSDL